MSYSFVAASATLRHQRDGSGTKPSSPLSIGTGATAVTLEDAEAGANPYAVFAKAALPAAASGSDQPDGTVAMEHAAAAPNPYAKFAAAAASTGADATQAPMKAASPNLTPSTDQAAAQPANPYERFLQPTTTNGPAANGILSKEFAKTTAAGVGSAASLQAVALLAAHVPPDDEVCHVPLSMPCTTSVKSRPHIARKLPFLSLYRGGQAHMLDAIAT